MKQPFKAGELIRAERMNEEFQAVESRADAARDGARFSIGGLSSWANSSITIIRRGNTFTITASFTKGSPINGYNQNVAFINNAQFRPTSTIALPAVSVIAGNPAPYQAGAVIVIEASGNVHCYVEQATSAVYVMGAWLV
ncbi:Uncharacterised protein [Actinobaculum suis]|uniref:Uncharacterized protein n=1 Tax=Actinobaculum suis TaxID=1657 RepID=A0A7Z8YB60_9ACTO|nr:Uncharacterised protein [Actinobaculum suis]